MNVGFSNKFLQIIINNSATGDLCALFRVAGRYRDTAKRQVTSP
jgi:hypothetical protein